MCVRRFCRGFDLGLGVFLCRAVRNVVANGVVEENGFLTDNAGQGTKRGQLDLAGVDTVDQNASASRFIKSRNQIDDRALARTAGADQCDDFAFPRGEIDSPENRNFMIGECDVLET